jgi:transposase
MVSGMGKETPKRPNGIPADVWADAGGVARDWMTEQARRLGLNSGNSSLPPSSDRPAAPLLGGLGRLSQRMIARLVGDLFGLTVSDGQISRLQRIGRESLQSAYEEITADVRESAAVNMDETGWREDGRRTWLWTAVGRLSTLFAVRSSRSRAVMRELLGDDFDGVLISDRYSAYASLPDDRHQFCWAHLLRDFEAMTERGGDSAVIGRGLKESGRELIHHWNRLQRNEIVRSTFDRNYRRLRDDIVEALLDGTNIGDAKTAETCRRLSNHCYSLFAFAHIDGVSPTNNAAERALRQAVIFRKLSFGTESRSGSKTLAVVMSVIETCRRLGRHALGWITDAVTHKQQNRPTPTLLPST